MVRVQFAENELNTCFNNLFNDLRQLVLYSPKGCREPT